MPPFLPTTASLTTTANRLGAAEGTALQQAIIAAREVLACVTDNKYLEKIYGRRNAWGTAVQNRLPSSSANDFLSTMAQATQAQLVYVALTGLVAEIQPCRVGGKLPSETGQPLSTAEQKKFDARMQLLTAADNLLSADPRENNRLAEKRQTISHLRSATEMSWIGQSQGFQPQLF